jgi:hypothetical protein
MATTAKRAAKVFAVVLLVYLVSPVHMATDSVWAIPTALSLIRERNADLDEFGPSVDALRGFQTVEGPDGRTFYRVPIGVSLTALPFAAAGLAVPSVRESIDASIAGGQTNALDPLVASIYTAGAAALLVLIAGEVGARSRAAIATGLLFAFGTAAWSTTSRSLWMHGPLMFFVTLSLWLLLVARRARRPALWYAGAGAASAFSIVVRPTAAIITVAFAAFVAVDDRRRMAPMAAGGASVAVLAAGLNVALFGSPLPDYLRLSTLVLSGTTLEALAGNVVSPARGLLVYSPIFLLVPVGVYRHRQKGEWFALDLALGAAIVVHLVVVSCFPHWWGGFGYGPRFMSDVLPLLTWFLVPVLDAVVERDVHTPRRPTWLLVAVLTTVAWSVFVNARGAVDEAVVRWNVEPVHVDQQPSRLWDWSDPPFLR